VGIIAIRTLPTASIVIDNYNYKPYVGGAIESALGQSHRDFEVLVVDDGSSDGSRDVIAAYGDRVRTIFKDNGGQASAVNAGYAASRGGLVCFLDADDVLAPTAIESAEAAVGGDPGICQVHWPLWQLDASGARSGGVQPTGTLPEGDIAATTLESGPLSHVISPMSGNAFSRGFLERVLPMPEEPFRLCADAYLLALAPLYGRLARLEEPHGGYRLHGSGGFAGTSFGERVRQGVALVELLSGTTAEHARALGLEPRPSLWAERSWWHRVARAVDDVKAVIDPSADFLLIDDDVLGLTWDCRRAHPFTERDGMYWGPPADDPAAVAELRRMRAAGARYAVVASWSFWWLDHYPGLAAELEAGRPVLDDDRVKVFDLGPAARDW
jgi:glycosyltransferase involved in cell wall biosynthesis